MKVFIRGRGQAKQDVERLPNDGHTLELVDFDVEIEPESLSCRAPHDLDYHCQHMLLEKEALVAEYKILFSACSPENF